MVKLVKRGLKYWARERNYEPLDDWISALPHVTADINDRFPAGFMYYPV